MTDSYSLTVEFERLRPEQVLALQAMFERWETYGRVGSSRRVAYLVDGDGTFHPSIETETDLDAELTDLRREAAEVSPNVFDHDPLVFEFRDDMPSLADIEERDGE